MKNIKKISNNLLLLVLVSIMLFTSETFAKFVYTANGLAWQNFFTAFQQVDDFIVDIETGEVSDKLFGPEPTEGVQITMEEKTNVFGTYFVPGSGDTREETFNDIVNNNEWKLDSIQNLEFNVFNASSTQDMLITFNVHYYARKDSAGAARLQFSVYNTKNGKIDSPFDDTSGKVWKGEFLQVGDGNVFDLTSEAAKSITKPFEEIPNLILAPGSGNKLAVGSKDDNASYDNYLSIRYGGEDNISIGGGFLGIGAVDYCPHHAHINQYKYGSVSSSTEYFTGPNVGRCDSWIHVSCKCASYYYLSSREVLSASDLSEFILEPNATAGFNINIRQGDGAEIDDKCFISAVTITATPCVDVWDNYTS